MTDQPKLFEVFRTWAWEREKRRIRCVKNANVLCDVSYFQDLDNVNSDCRRCFDDFMEGKGVI